MQHILKALEGGDLRSIGKANQVVKQVIQDPSLFPEIFSGLQHLDPVIRMRAADVIEKVSKECPDYLQPYKKKLLTDIVNIPEAEVRWHLAQLFSYLKLTTKERKQVADVLFLWVESVEESKIVKVMALQTLAQLANQDAILKERVQALLQKLLEEGAPAIKARCRKLLTQFS